MTLLRSHLTTVLLVVGLAAGIGCNGGRSRTPGQLSAPATAPAFEERYAVAYDNGYTDAVLNLRGRAPNDVYDQSLFHARLGYADLVAVVRVDQVWGKGLYEGRQDQYMEVTVGDVLLGELPRKTESTQVVPVRTDEALPGTLQGDLMLMFVRWDPKSSPSYRHHLMPADTETISLIQSMVSHAKDSGVISASGKERGARRRKRERKARKNGGEPLPETPTGEIDGSEP